MRGERNRHEILRPSSGGSGIERSEIKKGKKLILCHFLE
jgi:hypothetical protein